MTKHAKLSASGAARWMGCSGSIKAEEGLPDKSSSYAELGTVLHDVAEHMIVTGSEGDEFIDKEHHVFDEDGNVFARSTVMADHIEKLREYRDYVINLGGQTLVEQRVDFSEWVPGGFGTADAVVFCDDTLHVIDLKTGKGVLVEAENNPQLMLYALGSWEKFNLLFDFSKVVLTIHQPFRDHVDVFEITVDALLEWADTVVQPAAKLALSEDAPRVAGEKQCQFCKAKSRCREYANRALEVVADDFANISTMEIKQVGDLSDEEIAAILEKIGLARSFLKSIEETATATIMEGKDIPNFKLVAGRSIRAWRDKAEAETAIRKKLKVVQAYKKELISPTQAEKLLGKGHPLIEDLTVKPEGKPTLAPVTDKRPALVFNTVEDDFDGFDTEAA